MDVIKLILKYVWLINVKTIKLIVLAIWLRHMLVNVRNIAVTIIIILIILKVSMLLTCVNKTLIVPVLIT